MNAKKILLFVVLANFLAVAAWGVSQVGFLGLFTEPLGSPAGIVGTADLLIALGLVSVWMIRDARAHGVSAVPYLMLTVVLGSVGPLLYLLRRPEPAVAETRSMLAARAG